jgi:predicted nucleic acid-binding protein
VPRYAYLDASAIAKLVVAEAESDALQRDLALRSGLVSSRLGAVEVQRAARRSRMPRVLQHAEDVLAALVLLELTPAILERAGRLAPPELRTLDALHLATAMMLTLPGLDFITYDGRLADAARAAGLAVVQPGRSA